MRLSMRLGNSADGVQYLFRVVRKWKQFDPAHQFVASFIQPPRCREQITQTIQQEGGLNDLAGIRGGREQAVLGRDRLRQFEKGVDLVALGAVGQTETDLRRAQARVAAPRWSSLGRPSCERPRR